jgi:hypothetical protein
MNENNYNKLLILWTSNDKESAINMVFMYAENSMIKGWWEEVTLLIWGSSSKLVSEDEEVQNSIKSLQKEGVRIIACRQCAENYNIVEKLEKQDIEVFYTGEFLSDWLKSNKKIITI